MTPRYTNNTHERTPNDTIPPSVPQYNIPDTITPNHHANMILHHITPYNTKTSYHHTNTSPTNDTISTIATHQLISHKTLRHYTTTLHHLIHHHQKMTPSQNKRYQVQYKISCHITPTHNKPQFTSTTTIFDDHSTLNSPSTPRQTTSKFATPSYTPTQTTLYTHDTILHRYHQIMRHYTGSTRHTTIRHHHQDHITLHLHAPTPIPNSKTPGHHINTIIRQSHYTKYQTAPYAYTISHQIHDPTPYKTTTTYATINHHSSFPLHYTRPNHI